MYGQNFSQFIDAVNDCAVKILFFEMFPHRFNQSLPELFAAFFVHTDVSDHGVFASAGRDKNQRCVSIARLVHSQLQKFLLRARQRLIIEFTSLNEDADLSGGATFRFLDCLRDSLVIEPAKKMMRPHFTSSNLRHRRQNLRHRN